MKNQGKSNNSTDTAEFLTMVGIVGIIATWIFYLIVDLLR
jgi:hypothetical protein